MSRKTLEERFWEKTIPEPNSGCILWLGASPNGTYGTFGIGRRMHMAHRVAMMLATGKPIPDGLLVLHRCDNPPCVNPAHLFLGTARDNMRDKVRKERHSHGVRLWWKVRLTPEQAKEVRRRYGAGESGPDLAREFGVTKGTVYQAALARSWKHLPDPAPKRDVRRAVIDQLGTRYESHAAAARAIGAKPNEVTRQVKGRARSVRGFTFRYADD